MLFCKRCLHFYKKIVRYFSRRRYMPHCVISLNSIALLQMFLSCIGNISINYFYSWVYRLIIVIPLFNVWILMPYHRDNIFYLLVFDVFDGISLLFVYLRIIYGRSNGQFNIYHDDGYMLVYYTCCLVYVCGELCVGILYMLASICVWRAMCGILYMLAGICVWRAMCWYPPGGSEWIISVGDYVNNSFTALGSSDPREVRLEL